MVKRAVLGDLILNYSAMFPKSRVRREHSSSQAMRFLALICTSRHLLSTPNDVLIFAERDEKFFSYFRVHMARAAADALAWIWNFCCEIKVGRGKK